MEHTMKTRLSHRWLSFGFGLSWLVCASVLAQNAPPKIIWGTTESPTRVNNGAASVFQQKIAPATAIPTKPAPAPVAPGANPATINPIKNTIALHEGRAAALQPIVVRDITARDALVADAAALDQTASNDRNQAASLRAKAASTPDSKTRNEFLALATEHDNFAKQSDESARIHREVTLRLDANIKLLQNAISSHLAEAAKLKTYLANNS
jgi:hypothetical protein